MSTAQRARAEALVEAGVNLAIVDLLAGRAADLPAGPRFGRSGALVSCTPGEGDRLAVTVTDEGGKVDVNTASPELVEALLTGLDRDNGIGIARSILALRQLAVTMQATQGVAAPTARAMRSVLELGQVAGIRRPLFDALLPLVTVHSGTGGVDSAVASPAVLQVLSPGGGGAGEPTRRAVPSAFAADSQGRAFLIAVESQTAAGARFSRDVVVEWAPDDRLGHRVHEQRDGTLRVRHVSGAGFPPC